MTAEDQSRVSTVVVAGLLRLIAAGLEPIEVEPYGPDRVISVRTNSGWYLLLQIDCNNEPTELHYAQPPSLLVQSWTYGCQRNDWMLGPDSRVITPVELLTAEQRQDLRKRLKYAPVRWQLRPLVPWDVSNLDEELILD